MTAFDIEQLRVGEGRCLVIAEVAQAHDGSLGAAHAFIDVAAECWFELFLIRSAFLQRSTVLTSFLGSSFGLAIPNRDAGHQHHVDDFQ